jgi:hypothetical protein
MRFFSLAPDRSRDPITGLLNSLILALSQIPKLPRKS